MMSSTENYGILRGAILVAAELFVFSLEVPRISQQLFCFAFPTGESSSRYATPPTTSPAKRKKTDLPEWQVAIEAPMLVSRSGPRCWRGSRS